MNHACVGSIVENATARKLPKDGVIATARVERYPRNDVIAAEGRKKSAPLEPLLADYVIAIKGKMRIKTNLIEKLLMEETILLKN